MPLPHVASDQKPYTVSLNERDRIINDESLPVVNVDPADLTATQAVVIPDRLARIKGDLREDKPVLIVRKDGVDYIEEGHHRAVAALRSGSKVPARIVEVGSDGKLHLLSERKNFSEADSGKDVALGGPDGRKVEQLLSASIEQGTKTLSELTRAAVTRLLERGPGAVKKATSLFTEEEQQQLADQLAATNATADLLGRVRIAERADEAERRAKKRADFAEFCGGKGGTKGPCPKGGAGKVAGIRAAKTSAAKPTVAGVASKLEGLAGKKLAVEDVNGLAGEMAKMRPSELQQLSAKVAAKPGGKAKVAKAKKAATAAVAKAKASPEPAAPEVTKPATPAPDKPSAPPTESGKPLAFDPAKETAVKAQSKDVLSKLNSSQKSAISDYTLGGSDDLNAELRKGNVPSDRDSQNMVQSMDAMFDAAPELPEPVNTYRGLAFKDPAKAQEFAAQMDAQIASGSSIEFPSYSSTSLDPEVANKFLSGHGKGGGEGVMMEIKSKHGVYLEGQNEMHAGEKEFLLKRGAKFKATGKRQAQIGGKTVTVYEMEQL